MSDEVNARFDLLNISAGRRLPQVINVFVEIPRGRRSKFEVDKETGLMELDRYLYSSSHYPGDDGFIPQMLAEDGDALDAVIMVNEATSPECLIEARVVGSFRVHDRTKPDCRIPGVPDSDPWFGEYRDIADVPSHLLKEVEHFFLSCEQLEGAEMRSDGWLDARVGGRKTETCRERWRDEQG